jgi:hypothetical protein
MAEEKKEKWLNYLALSTVIFAVAATLSTFKGGGFSSRAMLNQTMAANQWSYYQSKSIKSYIFENQKDNLELQKDLLAKTSDSKVDLGQYETKIQEYNKKLAQYDTEKAEIKAKAENFEKTVKDFQSHGSKFGIAVIFLQITILMSSIAGLMKKKYIWYISMGVGVIGLFYFMDGFLLFF